jgi:hypothetical protein
MFLDLAYEKYFHSIEFICCAYIKRILDNNTTKFIFRVGQMRFPEGAALLPPFKGQY